MSAAATANLPWPEPDPPKIPDRLDPIAKVFFVSHATAHDHDASGTTEPNTVFAQFHQDLSRDLDQLVARRSGADAGFLDRGLRAGSNWEREILTAIGTCQVLVALVSKPFCESPWCGKEWDAFTRRRTVRRADGALMPDPQCALPVLWTVDQQQDYPAIVDRFQRFRPRPTSQTELDQIYLREGIYGMFRAEKDAYRATVWRIAQEIKRLVTEYWVEPHVFDDSDALENVFGRREQA